MRKLIGWIVFALGVIGLTFWANGHQAEKIEAKVTRSADDVFSTLGENASHLTASTIGRDITIEGAVLKSDANSLKAQLSKAHGRRVVHMNVEEYDSFGPKFTANYDLGKGINFEGFSTADMDAASVGELLGVNNIQGSLSQTAFGEFGSAKSKLAALAPELSANFDTATIHLDGEKISFSGQVDQYVDQSALSAKIATTLGAGSEVTISQFEAPNGTERANIATGENEFFTNGYWLPNFDFQATLEECQARTDDILTNYKVTFVTGGADLDGESREAINRVSGVLRHCLADPSLKLELAGHTDSVGDSGANLTLSQDRANAVVEAIKARGISTDDVIAKGYGDTKPIASNDTDEGKQANRRTTITWATK